MAAEGIHIPAYVVHLHEQSVVEACEHLEDHSELIAYENTARRVSPKSYLKLLYGKRLVIDTAHLFSSGMARSSEDALALIKHLNLKSRIVAIHLND